MVAQYRYIFLSLIDDEIIEEIDCYGVNATRQLGDQGSFTASFQADQTGKNNADLVAATTPGKTWVVMERNSVPVWWGFVWSRTYQSQAKAYQISGLGFEAFPGHQRMFSDYTDTGASTLVFANLWANMQSSAVGRNLGINVPTIVGGPTVTVAVLASDESMWGDVMDNLATAADGFDYTIDLNKNNDGTYDKSLRIGFPTMGAQAGSDDLIVFEYPGAITNYYMTESMSNAGTDVHVLGSGEGSSQLVSDVSQEEMKNTFGWPRWDINISYKDVIDQDTLDQLALQQAINRKPTMPVIKATVKGDQDPVLGSYNIGDQCLVVITDPRNPSSGGSVAGLTFPSIVVGFGITPVSSEGVEEVNVILPGDIENG